MVVPKNINTQRIESHTLDHLDAMGPVLKRDSGVMKLASNKLILGKIAFSIEGTQ
jgi:hypothetical protein